MSVQVKIGDSVAMRKPHACGGSEWTVTGVGADIRLKCMKCGRRIVLDRDTFEHRVKSIRGEVSE